MERLAKKHEVLRTAIIYDGVTKFRQAIIRRKLIPAMADISGEIDKLEAAKSLRLHIMDTAFDLQRKPLFQVTCAKKDSESAYLIVAIHHAIADGWCRGISLNDFFRFLSGEITEIRTPDSAPEKGKYEKAVREILDKNKSNGLAY
ncbi:MAG: hypothetical protein IJS81_08040 [Selenomonadaceae bacterium]|nr:hypothetical protein [Selenomonadaceae bacterium]